MTFRERYPTILADAKSFEGYMNDLSIALFTSVLDFQERTNARGDIIEFGVYEGRSASILLHALRPGENATLVNSSSHPKLDRLRAINPDFRILEGKSERLVFDPKLASIAKASLRISHHDASHTFENLTEELRFIEDRITKDGVVILDDFGNWCYSQVVAAAYAYLFTEKSDLEVFLIASNKAYLCRKSEFQKYANFVIDDLRQDLSELRYDMFLARSDNSPSSRAFFIREKRSPDEADLYGLKFLDPKLYDQDSEKVGASPSIEKRKGIFARLYA